MILDSSDCEENGDYLDEEVYRNAIIPVSCALFFFSSFLWIIYLPKTYHWISKLFWVLCHFGFPRFDFGQQ